MEDFGWDPADAAIEQALLDQTNAARATGFTCNGVDLPAVTDLDPQADLTCAARSHALDMATHDFFAHDSPTTGDVSDRVDATGYSWGLVAENIAAGQPSADVALDDWLGSTTGHCENIMNGDAVHAGMGLARSETAELPTYWVQVFGAPL